MPNVISNLTGKAKSVIMSSINSTISAGNAKEVSTIPWGEVDKTNLPASSFAFVPDPDKRSTWKLPYRTSDGKMNIGGVIAAYAALQGARGGIKGINEEAKNKIVKARESLISGKYITNSADNGSFYNMVGHPSIFADNDSDALEFTYIAQTEGVHTDVSGKTISYTPDLLMQSVDSHVGKKLYHDPKHIMKRSGMPNNRPDVADITDAEVKRINQDMIEKFNLNPNLVGKYAHVNKAVGHDPAFNDMIRDGTFPFISTELVFTASQDNEGVYYPYTLKYEGGVILENEGADPGAVILEILNTKYGGMNMSDGNDKGDAGTSDDGKTSEDAKALKEQNEALQKQSDEAVKATETATEEAKVVKEENDKLSAENAKLKEEIEKNTASNSGEGDSDVDINKDVAKMRGEMDASNAKLEEAFKTIEVQNSTIQKMVNETRKEVLTGIVSNSEYVDSILNQNLDEEAFNAKLEEIKSLKELGAKEVEASNDTGVSGSLNAENAESAFKENFGMSKEDYMKKNLGVEVN